MKMSKFIISNLFISIFFLSNFANAQTSKVVVGQPNQLQIKLENQKSDQCNIEVIYPNGTKGEFIASKPDYVANIEFNPTTEGLNTIGWQGKFKARGVKSVVGCEGNGKLSVSAVPNNDTKIQRWRDVASKVSDKQKTCINAGLKLIKEDFDINSPSGEIKNDINDPISKEIRSRCEKFADIALAKNSVCKINEKNTFCDEYFEITISGSKKQFREDELFEFLFRKEQIQKLTIENPEAQNKREIAEAEEARKLEAYKKTPAYKKEQAELLKKQAELEKKKLNDEAIAKKAAEEEARLKIENMKEFIFKKPNSSENNVSEEVFLDVCRKTQYWHKGDYGNELVRLVVGDALYDGAAEKLIESGGADIQLQEVYVSKGNKCFLNFTVKGIYKGTSVNLNAICSVTKIIKMNNGGFKAIDYYVGSSCFKQ